jgi:alkylation response protein AidB-like acyl-CoA dehydrogenase
VRFALTPEQTEFREAVRSVLAKECTPADVRAAYDDPGWRTGRWTTLAGLGVTGLCVPEGRGGLGLGMVDLTVVLEEAGRAALPEPLSATAGVVAPLLTDLGGQGTDPRPAAWLEGLADGREGASIGLGPESEPVAGADGASLLALVRSTADGDGLFLLDAEDLEAGRASVQPVRSLDPTRRLGRVIIAADARPAVTGNLATELARRSRRRGVLTAAAELVGLADRLITIGADYAGARSQFGRPVGSFQAVKHLLAGARVQLEFARPAVYAAAWALDEHEPDAGRRVSAAKAQASEAALEAARVALQVHGAIGYTWECDLHLFLKRTWALAAAWGSAAEHRRRVLDSLVAERGTHG